jgi:hypothetical protein
MTASCADNEVPPCDTSPVLPIGAEVLPGKITVKEGACAIAQRRAAAAPLMVIFHGERLPGDRRTARLSATRVQAFLNGQLAARAIHPPGTARHAATDAAQSLCAPEAS